MVRGPRIASITRRHGRLTNRTAVYGPVRTVVWEERGREAPPYPDFPACPVCIALLKVLPRIDRFLVAVDRDPEQDPQGTDR